MAFWSPPTSADPDLKQQLFDFKVRLFFFPSLNFPRIHYKLPRHALDKRTDEKEVVVFPLRTGRAACTGSKRNAEL